MVSISDDSLLRTHPRPSPLPGPGRAWQGRCRPPERHGAGEACASPAFARTDRDAGLFLLGSPRQARWLAVGGLAVRGTRVVPQGVSHLRANIPAAQSAARQAGARESTPDLDRGRLAGSAAHAPDLPRKQALESAEEHQREPDVLRWRHKEYSPPLLFLLPGNSAPILGLSVPPLVLYA